MRINLLNIYNTNYQLVNKRPNFTSNTNIEQSHVKSDIELEIKEKVKTLMDNNRVRTTSSISNYATDQFKSEIIYKLNNANKFDDVKNKIKVLDQIAGAYIEDSQFEKALAITTQSIKEINENKTLSNLEKKKMILSPEHWYVIRRYTGASFYGQNYISMRTFDFKYNQKLLLNLMKQIEIANYDEFMPFVEYINTMVPVNGSSIERDINITTRNIINKHYDLSILENIQGRERETALKLIGDWGLPKHVNMIKKMIDNSNPKYDNVCANGLTALGKIGGHDAFEILKQHSAFYDMSYSRYDKEYEKYVEDLFNKICNNRNFKNYNVVALALAAFNNPKHARLLEPNLYKDNTKVKADTLDALAKIKSPVSLEILMKYLNTNPKPKSFGLFYYDNLYINLLNAFNGQNLTKDQIIKIRKLINENLNKVSVSKDIKKQIDDLSTNLGKDIDTDYRNYLKKLYPYSYLLVESGAKYYSSVLRDYTHIYGQYNNLNVLKSVIDKYPELEEDEKIRLTFIAGDIKEIEQLCKKDPTLLSFLSWEISTSPILMDLYKKNYKKAGIQDYYLGDTKEIAERDKNSNCMLVYNNHNVRRDITSDDSYMRILVRGTAKKNIHL